MARRDSKARSVLLAPQRPQRVARRAADAAADGRTKPIDLGGLDSVIGYALRRAQVAIFQDYGELTGDLGITTTHFAVLRLVHRNPGLNQTALANALGAETPRMVLIIDELARRGLVVRLASTMDRRARAIFLSPEGRKMHGVVSRRVVEQNRRMIQRLRGDDCGALLRMLRNLATPL